MPRDGIGIEETRSRTVVRKNEKRNRKNVGERKSRTPVMPRAGMRIEEPG